MSPEGLRLNVLIIIIWDSNSAFCHVYRLTCTLEASRQRVLDRPLQRLTYTFIYQERSLICFLRRSLYFVLLISFLFCIFVLLSLVLYFCWKIQRTITVVIAYLILILLSKCYLSRLSLLLYTVGLYSLICQICKPNLHVRNFLCKCFECWEIVVVVLSRTAR